MDKKIWSRQSILEKGHFFTFIKGAKNKLLSLFLVRQMFYILSIGLSTIYLQIVHNHTKHKHGILILSFSIHFHSIQITCYFVYIFTLACLAFAILFICTYIKEFLGISLAPVYALLFYLHVHPKSTYTLPTPHKFMHI